jgi:hypothetical protein
VRGHLGGCGPTQHLLGNYEVEIDGDARELQGARSIWHGAHDGDTFEALATYTDRSRGPTRVEDRARTMDVAVLHGNSPCCSRRRTRLISRRATARLSRPCARDSR